MSGIAKISDLESVFGSVVGVVLAAVGVAVLVMFVIGGLKFLTAGGDKDATSKAQKTITYALAGLVLTVSAYIILSLLGKFFGVDLSTFKTTL